MNKEIVQWNPIRHHKKYISHAKMGRIPLLFVFSPHDSRLRAFPICLFHRDWVERQIGGVVVHYVADNHDSFCHLHCFCSGPHPPKSKYRSDWHDRVWSLDIHAALFSTTVAITLLMFLLAAFSTPIMALGDGLVSRMAKRHQISFGS